MHKTATLIFLALCFLIGIVKADSTVVELYDVFYKQNNETNYVGTATSYKDLDRKLNRLEFMNIDADSIDILYKQVLYFPDVDSFAVIFRNYSNMLFVYDTLNVNYWDPDFWAAYLGASEKRYEPME